MSQALDSGASMAVALTSDVMVGAVIFLSIVVAFICLLYICARRYQLASGGVSRAHFIFMPERGADAAARCGLDPAVLRAIPVVAYRAANFKKPLDCAVCLSELAEGEQARVLPVCSHGFHSDCIDMWFHSHSTCPLCRCPVDAVGDAEPPADSTNPEVAEAQDQVNAGSSAAASAAVTGLQEGSSSSSGRDLGNQERMLVIKIPRRVVEGLASPVSPLPSSWMALEEMKSPPSARLRSLSRLLSLGVRTVGPSCSPRGGGGGGGADIEQGFVGEGSATTPKTPSSFSGIIM